MIPHLERTVRRARITFLMQALIFCSYCSKLNAENRHSPNKYELVLGVDSYVSVFNEDNEILIHSNGDLERVIQFKTCIFQVPLRIRTERWFGNLGGYNPGARSDGKSCQFARSVVLTEGQIHFPNNELALEWLKRRPKSFKNAYDGNGLSISWRLSPERQQISISINLLCVDGLKLSQVSKVGNFIFSGNEIFQCKEISKEDAVAYFDQVMRFWRDVDLMREISKPN